MDTFDQEIQNPESNPIQHCASANINRKFNSTLSDQSLNLRQL